MNGNRLGAADCYVAAYEAGEPPEPRIVLLAARGYRSAERADLARSAYRRFLADAPEHALAAAARAELDALDR